VAAKKTDVVQERRVAKKSEPKAKAQGRSPSNEPDNPIGKKGARGPKGVNIDASKITILAEKNPKREGTKAHARFELYKDGMSVREYLEAGGRTSAVKYDLAHEFIKLTE